MEARSGQNHDNKTAPQVNFTPTAASIMDLLCIFVITRQYFFNMLVIIFSNMSYFCFYYTNTFFIHTTNYFLVVLQIIFLMCIKNYFFIRPRIIFPSYRKFIFSPTMHCRPCSWSRMVRTFCSTSLGDHFKNFASRGVLSKRMPRQNIVRERNERGFRLSYKICQEPIVCVLVMRFSGPKI